MGKSLANRPQLSLKTDLSSTPQTIFTSPDGARWAQGGAGWGPRAMAGGGGGMHQDGRVPSPREIPKLTTIRVLKIDLSKPSFYLGQNRLREGKSLVACHTAAGSQP